jgi:protein ImuA
MNYRLQQMTASKADIIARLQREILPLQGIKPALNNTALDTMLGSLKNAFPNNTFPVGAVHEFIAAGLEDVATTSGFIACILTSLMQNGGPVIWIGSIHNIFPPALKSFGIVPDKIIFINLQKEKEMLWTMEEALKCEGLAAVIGEIKELNFTASRRLQLAVEQSRVTGFIIRNNPQTMTSTACVTRWKITAMSSELEEGFPGVGFPRWSVDLLKVRNGNPGKWQIEFNAGRFRHIYKTAVIPQQLQQKTG